MATNPCTNLSISRCVRRVGVAVAGCLIVIIGIALLILPGPGVLTIAAGIGLLASEFECARRSLHWCKARSGRFSKCFRYFSRDG